jgi:LysM repeat protein
LTVDELKELNNLTSDTIFENQELLLGFGGPLEVTATSGPSPTPTPLLPTPTPPGLQLASAVQDINGD